MELNNIGVEAIALDEQMSIEGGSAAAYVGAGILAFSVFKWAFELGREAAKQ
ncbi:hypothetical protein M0D21_22770 [Aquimarina sp. D1M17]|uniref:hypothetical protein n=1 Tax=Aquimarina acroporae TaxID=2937283 RepID=UPI0020BF203B|nr:hypothetical protein [Aquimarina acroporae]MCK8524417.1 hypothetical protein [Aquimarina acroporae]MCK8524419.1 hypothetical protein [Aquimarina acroporae]